MTRFCPWYSLAEAAIRSPAEAGVYQVKLPHVIDYPTGKSAMIHYGASADVRASLRALADANPGAPWRCRHAEEMPRAADPGALLADLVTQFRRRFGAEPRLPAAQP